MRSAVVGTVLIAIGVLLGVALDLGLYARDTALRAAQASLQPSATPVVRQAPPGPTAAVATATPGTVAPSAAVPGGSAAAGQRAFAAQCEACHPGANAGIGPALHGKAFASRYPDDGALGVVIRQGKGGMPPTPVSDLPDDDLNAVVAYLRSLK